MYEAGDGGIHHQSGNLNDGLVPPSNVGFGRVESAVASVMTRIPAIKAIHRAELDPASIYGDIYS